MSKQYSKEVFCFKLKRIRKHKGLTQVQTSELLGIKRNTYARYESGHAEPCHSVLYNISQIFNVSLDDLLDPNPDNLKLQ